MYFTANTEQFGNELWVSDGSSDGTRIVKDIYNGEISSNPSMFSVLGENLIYAANDGLNGREIWMTNLTDYKTELTIDIEKGSASSEPGKFKIINGQLYFIANNGIDGKEPWVTNGEISSTYMLADLNSGENGSDPGNYVSFNQEVVFTAYTDDLGYELWSLTNGEITQLTEITTVSMQDEISSLNVIDDKILFAITTPEYGRELWVYNGLNESYSILVDINPGIESSFPDEFILYDGKYYFLAEDGIHGRELWVTDGTINGTYLLKDLNNRNSSSNIQFLEANDSLLYFAAENTLWRSDGTSDGTQIVWDELLNPNNLKGKANELFFVGYTNNTDVLLWKTNGSVEGTVPVADVDPVSEYAFIENLHTSGDNLYFNADNGQSGMELWVSDGTSQGTYLIKDIWEGTSSSFPGDYINHNELVYFKANDGVNGNNIWTVENSTLNVQIQELFDGEVIQLIGVLNDELIFVGNDDSRGSELWKYSLGDLESPLVVTKDINLYLDEHGMVELNAKDIDDGSTDNETSIENLKFEVNFSQFDCSDLGDNQVTLFVTDLEGNIGSATSLVTVLDTLSPVILIKDTVLVFNGYLISLSAVDLDIGSYDNCGIKSISLSKEIFGESDLGINNVEFVAYDYSDNNSIVNFNITLSNGLLAINPNKVNEFKVYPNPSKGRVSFINSSGTVNEYEIFIYTTDGKLERKLYSGIFQNNEEVSVSIVDLKASIYILQFRSDNEIFYKKLMIDHQY
nr:T9SS type A sorting domain-containing protein [Marinigracilibium pacificum]